MSDMNEKIALTPSHYIPVSGSHPKAEMYYQAYQLAIKNQILLGTFFPHCVETEQHLFITEATIEMLADGSGILRQTALVQFDLGTGQKKILSSLHEGMIKPLRVEGQNIIYTKADLNESIIREFEQPIISASNG